MTLNIKLITRLTRILKAGDFLNAETISEQNIRKLLSASNMLTEELRLENACSLRSLSTGTVFPGNNENWETLLKTYQNELTILISVADMYLLDDELHNQPVVKQ